MSRYKNEDGTIKWNKSDEQRLKNAVSEFNRKRRQLINQEKKIEDTENKVITNTIEKEKYSDLKKVILTRENLNETIKSLRDFANKKTATQIDKNFYNETGRQITKWQNKQIQKNVKIAKARLEKELEEYKKPVEGSGGLSKLDMKNTTAQHIENQIKWLENYKDRQKTNYEFRKAVKGLKHIGSIDYSLWLDINYKANYIDVMKAKYKGFDGYKDFIKHLESIPATEFYNTIKPKNEKDYAGEDGSDLYRQSNETLTITEFHELMKRWRCSL